MIISAMNIRKALFGIIGALLSIACVVGGYAVYMHLQGNFHVITDGEAFRSAQLDRDQLEHYIRQYNIKSIINLRGLNNGHKWYQDEINVSKAMNVAHYDIALGSTREPSAADVERLIGYFNKAERPVLIHCMGGSDRTGLAAAMWKVSVNGASREEASNQLSIIYGHIPFGDTTVMDRFFEKWEHAYKQKLLFFDRELLIRVNLS